MSTHLVSSLDIIRAVKPHPFLYDRHIKCSIREKADKWAELGEQLGISGNILLNVYNDKITPIKEYDEMRELNVNFDISFIVKMSNK